MQQPKATLISSPEYPIGTLYFIWEQSRSQTKMQPVSTYNFWYQNRHYLAEGVKIYDTVRKILQEDVPVTECLYFTFYLENVPVSLREQLVRHRIGSKVGPEMGYDIIPDLPSSTFWSQTSRAVSQSDFANANRFITPESIADKGDAFNAYYDFMLYAQTLYTALIDDGIPMEDARQVLPLAATQTMTWTLSLKSIQHILGKRACWIAQHGLWGPIIADMARAMEWVDELFADLVSPPCFSKGEYKSCPIKMINEDRINGVEPYQPCPMYVNYENDSYAGVYDGTELQKFRSMWNRDPVTGERIK